MSNSGLTDFNEPLTNQPIAGDQSTTGRFTLTTADLSKRFNREWIFRRFSASFSSGNVYAITGPNGSGKSTLLQVLWGQVPPTSGTIRYHKGNKEIPQDDVFSHISVATPYMDLIEEFSLKEQLDFHFKLKRVREGRSLDELIDIMYLSDARDKYISNFSSGMRQRLKLALALHTEADVIFLDEPGTNLDDRAFAWYKSQLSGLPSEVMVFIASNNPSEYPESAKIINLPHFKR